MSRFLLWPGPLLRRYHHRIIPTSPLFLGFGFASRGYVRRRLQHPGKGNNADYKQKYGYTLLNHGTHLPLVMCTYSLPNNKGEFVSLLKFPFHTDPEAVVAPDIIENQADQPAGVPGIVAL